MLRKVLTTLLVGALALTLAAPASAKPPPVTKLKFKLDAHEVPAGTPVTGGVYAWTRDEGWEALPGILLSVKVDGLEVATLTTDANGYAAVSYAGAEGEHVMKVVYAGDDLHKEAQRAQGFTVTPGAPVPAPTPAPPTAPDAPALSVTGLSADFVRLEWAAPADGGSPITAYRVLRSEQSGQEMFLDTVGGTTLTYDDTAVFSGQVLYYVVTAVNAVGESVWSNEVQVLVP